MEDYTLSLPSYSIGENVYQKIGEICTPYGTKAVAIGGEKAINAAKDKILAAVKDTKIEIVDFVYYGGEASYENVEMLTHNKAVQAADMIFAIGGGKALDTAKALGETIGKAVFAFPTIASTCAGTTSVSIMYYPDGRFKKPFFLKKPPVHTFIDLFIIAHAPTKYMWAGMGDTIAKHYESTVSSRGDELKHYHAMGVTLSRMCVEPIYKYGPAAMEANKTGMVNQSLEETVLAIIVTTGICSIFLTMEGIIDYNTGLAHGVFYALTSYPNIEKNHLHGEVVGYGVLILLLVDEQLEEFRRAFEFAKAVKLPIKLADLEISADELSSIVPKVLQMKDIDKNPYVITEEMLYEAFKILEEYK